MTEGAWKMIIPYANIFSFSSAENLKEIAGIAPSTNRLNALQTAYEWMLLLATGKRILLEVDEWVNKSSGRNDFRLIVQSQDGSEKTIYAWPFLLLRGISYEQFIPDFFPWADFCIDEPFYKGYDEDNYREECGVWDAEQGEYIIFTESFSEWASRSIPKGIRPYKLDGTVACWRLEFTLNELGKAYVKVNKYLTVDVV